MNQYDRIYFQLTRDTGRLGGLPLWFVFRALPTVVAQEAANRYGLRVIGEARNCRVEFQAITAERRIGHPAVERITQPVFDRRVRGVTAGG